MELLYIGLFYTKLSPIREKEISSSQSEETTTKRIQHVEEYVTLEESLQVDYSNIPNNKLKKKSALGFVMHSMYERIIAISSYMS